MTKKKVAIMIDSEFGWSEKEARERGYFFVPIVFEIDGVKGYSGVDYTLEWIYENLGKDTVFKTSTSEVGMIQEEYRRALEVAEHVLYIPLTKHFSSQMNSARLAAEDAGLSDKVTVYESEFISPWQLIMNDKFEAMMERDAELEEYIEVMERQRGNMFAWLFPNGLERLRASGRLSKAAYMAGTLLRITPVTPVINGMLDPNGVVKARSKDKALDKIVDNTIAKYEELKAKGLDVQILLAVLGNEDGNEFIDELRAKFAAKGVPEVPATWISAAVVGHVGLGGIGAGVGLRYQDEENDSSSTLKDKF